MTLSEVCRDPTDSFKSAEHSEKLVDLRHSIGLVLKDDGAINDVIPGLPAAQAGLAPGMKLLGVNGRKFSGDPIREAVKASNTSTESLELLAEQGEFYQIHRLDYRGGPRYPHLERNPAKPDLLSSVLKPLGTFRPAAR